MKLKPCPVCGGEAVLLGALGYRTWKRCQNCGLQFQEVKQDKRTAKYRKAERKAKERYQRWES